MIEFWADLAIGSAACVAIMFLYLRWETKMTPSRKWDMEADHMRLEGYSELDIREELGVRPEEDDLY